jgi:Fe-S-cluster-containing dehydrogenase component
MDDNKKWGMVVDLNSCTGCQACVTACAMENNIPSVGEDEMAYGRGLPWIRIERTWQGDLPFVKPDFQPVMCQQCGNAPCESVCPVYASVHSDTEQINLQVYNRCIGTRYCANNCPYIARSFNFFDYETPEPLNYAFNPDVTVRQRGVVEKCTFCIQRINKGQDDARAEGRAVADGEIVPACAQACPTEAIIFGDLSDPNSRVSKMAKRQSGYQLLEQEGTLPRVTYLKGGGEHGG